MSSYLDNIKHNKNILEYSKKQFKEATKPIGMATLAYDSEDSYSYDSDSSSEPQDVVKQCLEEDSSYSYSSEESEEKVTFLDQIKPTNSVAVPLKQRKDEDVELMDSQKEIPKWRQKVTCKICGSVYARSGATSHRKTKKHKLYEKANSKFLQFMLRD